MSAVQGIKVVGMWWCIGAAGRVRTDGGMEQDTGVQHDEEAAAEERQ